MKRYIIVAVVLLATINFAYTQGKRGYYGEKISDKNVVTANELPKMMEGKTSLENIRLEGQIIQTCKKKGCWMTIDMGNDQKLMVRFKDYGFFVPLDDDGKKTIIQGSAKKELIDVATLRHYAEDAGKSKEEIEKINSPEEKYTFEAIGVIIEDSNGAK